jgi:hypothetical protein
MHSGWIPKKENHLVVKYRLELNFMFPEPNDIFCLKKLGKIYQEIYTGIGKGFTGLRDERPDEKLRKANT